MRIAFFTDTFYPQVNGVSNTLRYLSLYLRQAGVEHVFFAPEYGFESEECAGLPIVRYRGVCPPIYPDCRLVFPSHARLTAQLADFEPDLVHIVTEAGIGFSGLMAARELGLPVLMSYHTNFDQYLTHYGLPHLKQVLWSYLRWFHSFALLNLAPSWNTLRELECRNMSHLALWPRGISTERFSPSLRSEARRASLGGTGKTVYLYVGRVSAEKGLDVLLQSLPAFNSEHGDEAVFWVTGDGPYRSQLENAGFSNLVLTGEKRGAELAEIYASADVFVFPSGTETFGNVVLEAMASGLPVICTDSGGVTDYTAHAQNALVTRYGDAEDLTRALRAMLDPTLRETLCAGALQTAAGMSWENVFDGLMEHYARILVGAETRQRAVKGA